jgi:hypothetical protein
MILQGQVGPQVNSDGIFANTRQDRQGGVVVSELNPRFYENTYRGQKFSACLTAAGVIGVLAATNVSFALYNPPNSGKNLVLVAASFAGSTTVFGTGAVFFAYSPQVTTPLTPVALTIKSNLLTGNPAASVAAAYSSATLSATPTAVRPFFGAALTATVGSSMPVAKDDISGEIIVAPGGVLSIQGSVAAVATGFVGISWDEVAV